MLTNVWNDQEADTKNRLLRSVAGSGVEQITELQTKWDKLELLMESHELMIKEQVLILAELLDYSQARSQVFSLGGGGLLGGEGGRRVQNSCAASGACKLWQGSRVGG